jgi:hypothetical protein
MGTSLFLWLNGFGFNLTWLCSGEEGMEKARKTFRTDRKDRKSGLHSDIQFIISPFFGINRVRKPERQTRWYSFLYSRFRPE